MTPWWLGAIIVLLSACTAWPVVGRSVALLERADHLTGRGHYAAAVRAYDEFLAAHPDDPAAVRALASRDTAAGILVARDEIARLRVKLESRDGEAGRLRQELTRLTAETERLRAEADRLRTDLEQLKRLDLEQERRRR